MPIPTKDNLRQMAAAIRQLKATQRRQSGPEAKPPLDAALQSPEIEPVEITDTSTTPGPGDVPMYPGYILEYNEDDGTDTQLAACWVIGLNTGALTLGKYHGRRHGDWTDGVPIFRIGDAGGSTGSTRELCIVKVTSATTVTLTDTSEVVYPGKIYYREVTGTLTPLTDCWIRPLNGLLLANGYFYLAAIGGAVSEISHSAVANSGYVTGTNTTTLSSFAVTGLSWELSVDAHIFTAGVTISSITYGSATFARVAVSPNSANQNVDCWRAIDNANEGPHSGNIVVTLSGTADFIVTAVARKGVDQSTPTEGSATSATASVSVTTTTADCWVHGAIITDDTSVTAASTSRNNVSQAGKGSGANEDTGALVSPGAHSISYTGNTGSAAMVGYAIRPAVVPVVFVKEPLQVQDDDGNPTYAAEILQFDQDDAFVISNPADGTAKIDLTASVTGITVEEQDGSPSYPTTTTLQFHQDDGFVVSQPAANKALVRQTATITSSTITNLTLTSILNNSITYLTTVTISSNQNNYSVGIGIFILIVNCTSASNITGIAISGGNNIGRPLFIVNVGSANLTLKHASGSSSSSNQFYLPGAVDVIVASGGSSYSLMYGSQSVWNAAAPAYQSIASIAKLVDPGTDSIGFWDDSASDWAFLSAGSGLQISGTTLSATGMPLWTKVTKSHTDFQTAGTTNDVTIYSVPAKAFVQAVVIDVTANFTGGAIATYTLAVNYGTVNPASVNAFSGLSGRYDVALANGKSTWPTGTALGIGSMTGSTNFQIRAVSSGANLNASTAGSADFYLCIGQLP